MNDNYFLDRAADSLEEAEELLRIAVRTDDEGDRSIYIRDALKLMSKAWDDAQGIERDDEEE